MQTKAFLDKITGVRGYREQIVRAGYLPAQEAECGELAEPLPAAIQQMLAAQEIEQLYTHQVSAIDAVRAGESALCLQRRGTGCIRPSIFWTRFWSKKRRNMTRKASSESNHKEKAKASL